MSSIKSMQIKFNSLLKIIAIKTTDFWSKVSLIPNVNYLNYWDGGIEDLEHIPKRKNLSFVFNQYPNKSKVKLSIIINNSLKNKITTKIMHSTITKIKESIKILKISFFVFAVFFFIFGINIGQADAAITYVGGKGAGRANANSTTAIAINSGLAGGSGTAALEGDLVIVTISVGSGASSPTVYPTGYTPLTVQRTTVTTYDTNVQTSYKFMTTTPDTTVTIPATVDATQGQAYTIQVFRGVDQTTPLDGVTPTYATGTGVGNQPNPASITPSTAGAWIYFGGGGAAGTGTTLYTAAYLTNFLTYNGADTSDGTVGSGYYTSWSSGAYDGAAFGGGSTNAVNSWGATTLVLRPTPPVIPTVTTPTVTSITSDGATLGANVTSLGFPASISARGTCWGTSPAPTTNCVAEGGTTTGVFTHARTGMSPSTFYYYRGYATNTTGTAYSSVDGTFTTTAPPTTLGNGTDGSSSTIAPGAAATEIDRFSLVTPSGTDTVTGMTVTLAGNASAYTNIATVDVQTIAGVSKCSLSPTSNTVLLTGCAIGVTTSLTEYKILITPKTHANMSAVPGASYATTATVTSITSTKTPEGADSGSATITVDNASPATVTASTATAGDTVVNLAWTNPADSDFATNGTVVVLRRQNSAVADVPVEGTTYTVGNTIGTAIVACVVTGSAPATNCQSSGLTNGAVYHYKIFTRDSNGNYNSVGAVPTGSPATPAIVSIALIQQKTNSIGTSVTSLVTTLNTAATAGNLLVTGISIDKSSGTITVPSGFTLVDSGSGTAASGAFAYKVAVGGETSISWSWATTHMAVTWVGEYSGLESLDQKAETLTYLDTGLLTKTISTGTTPTTTQADELAFAFFASDSGNTVGTTRSWSNGFTTVNELVDEGSGTTGIPFLNVATKTLVATGTVESTLTHNEETTGDESYAMIATFRTPTQISISSLDNQIFAVGGSSTPASLISITDKISAPTITATNDIRIKIPASFNMTWDTTDTLANIGGTDWAKTGAASSGANVTVTYEDSNKTVVIPVSTNFIGGSNITVSGLSFNNFSAASSVDNLELEIDNAGTTIGTDDKTITIVAGDADTAIEVHGVGAQANFSINPLNDTLGEKFSVLKFQISDKATTDILPTLIDQITIPISGTGLSASTDIAWAELWDDTGSAQVATSTSITDSAIIFGTTPNGGGTAGLDTIASGATVRYTVNIYMKNSALVAFDHQTYIFSINDGNVDNDTSSSSSYVKASASLVSSVTGTLNVVHSNLVFTTQPPSTAIADTDFSGNVVVAAMDANSNIDIDFSESVILSAVTNTVHDIATGTLSSTDSGGVTKTPLSGIITWTDTKYNYAEVIDIKATSVTYSSGRFSTGITVSEAPIVSISLIQNKTATSSTTAVKTLSTTFDVAATAGNLLVTGVAMDKTSGAITVPTGFTLIHSGVGTASSGALAYKFATGGETAITWNWVTSERTVSWAAEYSGLEAFDQKAENEVNMNDSPVTSNMSTGTTPTTTQADELAIAFFAVDSGNTIGSPASRSWSNGFTSLNEVGEDYGGSIGSPYLNVGSKILNSIGTVESTFSHGGSDGSYATIATFKTPLVASISSAINQTFLVGQATTAMSTITLTDRVSNPVVTAANDIRIKIPATFNMTWDITDTLANIGGAAYAKTGAASSGSTVTVTYEDSNKTLVIPVTTDFLANDSITIYGLSFTGFSAPSNSDKLELEVNNAGTTISYDNRNIIVNANETIVSSHNNAPSGVNQSSTLKSVGTFKFNGSGTVTQIILTEYGTTDSDVELENIKLLQDDGDGIWEVDQDTTQLGSTTVFNASDKATFSGFSFVAGPTAYVHVVLDVKATAIENNTIGIEIYQASDITSNKTVTATAWPVVLGTTNILGPSYTIFLFSDARPGNYAGTGMSLLIPDLNQADNQMGEGWTLSAVHNLGDVDCVTATGCAQNMDGAFNASELKTVYDLPHFYSVGNHEAETPQDMTDIRAKYAGYPAWNLKPGPTGAEETTYSYDLGEMHVVHLNIYWDGANNDEYFKYGGTEGGYIHDNLFAWLKNDLRTSNKQYKVVISHEPAYPKDRHVGDSLDQDVNNRNKFMDILRTERVVALLSGHDHNQNIIEYDGVFQVDTGASGSTIGEAGNDPYATIGYLHQDNTDGFQIRFAKEDPTLGWAASTVSSVNRSDLRNQVLVNTAAGAGTYWDGVDSARKTKYFIDYTATNQASNPNWTGNNSSKWWETAFDDTSASWTNGEISIGYDETTPASWINTPIAKQGGVYGTFQRVPFKVYDKNSFGTLRLGVDYDDAITVWLNGTEIHKSATSPTVGADDVWDKIATGARVAAGEGLLNPSYTWIDVSQHVGLLNEGNNILAIGNWNLTAASDDLTAAVKLVFEDSIFIADTDNNRIMKRNQADLSYKSKIGTIGTGNDNFSGPYGITTDNDHLWVIDTTNDRIVKRQKTDDLAFVSSFTRFGADAVFNLPRGAYVDDTYIYVADTANHRLVRGNKTTLAYVDQFGVTGVTATDNTHLDSPAAVYVDDTHVYVSDSGNHRVVKLLKSNLSYVSQTGTTGTPGTSNDTYNKPYGISGDSTYIYFSDEQNKRIFKRRKSDFSYVTKRGITGDGTNEYHFVLPKQLDTDDNYIYVAVADGTTTINARVKKLFKSDLSFVSEIGGNVVGTGNDQFDFVRGITTDHRTFIVPTLTYNLASYRMFTNLDSTDIGSAITSQNTPASLEGVGDDFRLRLLMKAGATLGVNGQSFKLQFAEKSGTCDANFTGETYADVTNDTVVSYKNNYDTINGSVLTPNAIDPTFGADTIVNQTYIQTAGTFTNSIAPLSAGQLGKWDFSLFYRGVSNSTSYCLRVVKSDGNLLDTYTAIPEIISKVYRSRGGGSSNVENSATPNTPNTGGTNQGGGGNTVLPKCSDGIDNDGDTLIDTLDSNCHEGDSLGNPYLPNYDSEAPVVAPCTVNCSGGGSGGDLGYNQTIFKSIFNILKSKTLRNSLLGLVFNPF